MSPLAQVGLITLGAVALYGGLRSLPDEACQILHMEPVVVVEGEEPEYCGVDEARYLDLDRLRYAVTSDLTPLGPVEPGVEGRFRLRLTAPDGSPLREEQIGLTHTKRIHLLVIDPTLDDYHHVHPVETQPGLYEFSFTPEATGTYHFFAEFVPKQSQRRVVLKESVTVGNSKAAGLVEPVAGRLFPAGPYEFELVALEGEFRLRQDNDLSLRIRSTETGERVRLEEIMGAYAHLVAFDENRRGFAHMHPLDDGVGLDTEEARFGFAFNTDRPGRYRVWAQVKVNGEEIFAPFDVLVEG